MIDPRGLSVFQWCDGTALDLSGLLVIPKIEDEREWERWAITISSNTEISPFHPPDPRGFTDWREWAMRFIQAVPL